MALVAVDDDTELAVRVGTGATVDPVVRNVGDPVALGLDRKDVIIIPGQAS